MNPYRLLGVRPGDDADAIRSAYRRYVAMHHPDRGGDPAAFQRGVDAFQSLAEVPTRVRGTLGTHRREKSVVRFVRRFTRPRHSTRRVI
jgi:hypothetical protein